jgi:hypothetical protein
LAFFNSVLLLPYYLDYHFRNLQYAGAYSIRAYIALANLFLMPVPGGIMLGEELCMRGEILQCAVSEEPEDWHQAAQGRIPSQQAALAFPPVEGGGGGVAAASVAEDNLYRLTRKNNWHAAENRRKRAERFYPVAKK